MESGWKKERSGKKRTKKKAKGAERKCVEKEPSRLGEKETTSYRVEGEREKSQVYKREKLK